MALLHLRKLICSIAFYKSASSYKRKYHSSWVKMAPWLTGTQAFNAFWCSSCDCMRVCLSVKWLSAEHHSEAVYVQAHGRLNCLKNFMKVAQRRRSLSYLNYLTIVCYSLFLSPSFCVKESELLQTFNRSYLRRQKQQIKESCKHNIYYDSKEAFNSNSISGKIAFEKEGRYYYSSQSNIYFMLFVILIFIVIPHTGFLDPSC